MRWTSSSVRSLVRRVGSIWAAAHSLRAVVGPTPYRYVREIWICFSRGRSTPEMRAIGLPLPLLVARIGRADDPHDAFAPDDLALHADLLHRCADLHGSSRHAFRAHDGAGTDGFPIPSGAAPRLPSRTTGANPAPKGLRDSSGWARCQHGAPE